MTFYNTINLSGQALSEALQACDTQEETILALYRHSGSLTPSEAWSKLGRMGHAWPITSVRRAISCLTEEGSLVKLDAMKEGIYGKPEHLWVLTRAGVLA